MDDAGRKLTGERGANIGETGGTARLRRRDPAGQDDALALRRADRELTDFFANASIGVHWLSPAGIILRANRAQLEMLGYEHDEYVGRHVVEFHVDRPAIEGIFARLRRGEDVGEYESRLRCKHGAIRDVRINSGAVLEDGELLYRRCFVRDVTEQKKAEAANSFFAAIVRNSDDAIISKDLKGTITSWNEAAERMFGYTAQEAIGRSITMLIPPDRQHEEPMILEHLRRGDRFEHFETIRVRKDGTKFDISLTISPVKNSQGSIIGISKVARDITDQKRGEREREALLLAERNARDEAETLNDVSRTLAGELDLQNLVQSVTDAGRKLTLAQFGAFFYNVSSGEGESYYLFTLSGAPREAFEKFGLPRNTAVFEPTFRGTDVIRSDDITRHPAYGKSAPHYGMPEGHLPVRSYLAVPVVSRSGEVLGGLFFGHAEPGIFTDRAERLAIGVAAQAAVAIDNAHLFASAKKEIAERRQAEEALRKSEAQFRQIADSMPQIVWTARPDGYNDYFNERWYEYTGFSRDQFGQSAWEPILHPDDLQRCLDRYFSSIRNETPYEIEYRFKDRRTGGYRWFMGRALPIRDEDDRVVKWLGTCTDIDDQKRLEAELVEADRRKDEFLATLAHELRNPLAPIRTGLEILKLAKDDRETLEKTRVTMERQTLQLIRLIDDLLDVSRVTRGKLELRKTRVKLADVVETAVETTRPLIDEAGHELEIAVPAEDIVFDADPHRLAQVFSNLLNNAAKYTPAGGRIRLSAERDGDDVVIKVTDTGLGIPADMLDRIFVMFVQIGRPLEKGYTGLGIGLTLVKSVVEMHGGRLEVRSEGEDRGSEFSVRLPILSPAAAGEELQDAPPDRAAASGCRRRVLIVDDNEASVETLSLVVRMLGNEVRTARDGRQAVEIAAEFLPDVILMDIGMPIMNGYEATRRIRQEPWGKNMTIVALTGWGQSEDRRKTREGGFDHHLVKPTEPSELQRLLSEHRPR